jgi:hypothetical protein
MRVHDLIAQHSIPWPPQIAAILPTSGELLQAILLSAEWRSDGVTEKIALLLGYHGPIVAASIDCDRRAPAACRTLYEALQRGVGLTLAEVEKLEVTL